MCLVLIRRLVIGLSVICWFPAEVRAEDHPAIGTIREAAEKDLGDLETEEVFKEAEVVKKYLAALEMLEKKLAADGKLDEIVHLREEKEAVRESGKPTGHQDASIAELRGKYLQLLGALRKETDEVRAKVVAGVKRAIAEKERELVKSGDVDGALKVRQDGERLLGGLPGGVARLGAEVVAPAAAPVVIRTAGELKSFMEGSVWKVTSGSWKLVNARKPIQRSIEFGADGNATADNERKLGKWWCDDDLRTFHVTTADDTGVFGPDWNSFELVFADGSKMSAIRVTNSYRGRIVRVRLSDDARLGFSFRKGRPVQVSSNADPIRMVCGLSNPDYVSLQSPAGGSYLRHIKYILECHECPEELNPLFRSDATFKVIALEDGAVRFEAVNFPGFFLTLEAGRGHVALKKDPPLPVSRFRLEPGG